MNSWVVLFIVFKEEFEAKLPSSFWEEFSTFTGKFNWEELDKDKESWFGLRGAYFSGDFYIYFIWFEELDGLCEFFYFGQSKSLMILLD